jgi:PAS domain S-box-containing protein
VGRTSLELGWITEEDRRHLINNLQRDGLVQDTELKLRTKDGRIVHCLFNGVIVTIHGQQVLLSIAQDITSRKQYEKELQELTHFNKEIITGAGEGIIVYDREFRYKLWNRFMEELTGIHAEEVINRNALEIFPHLRDQKIDELLGSALAGETVTSTDTDFFISKTGRSGWVTGTYTPQRDGQGEIVGVIAIIRDITSQKEAEEVLRESEERFRLLAENAPDAIFITTEKRFAYLNKEATNVLGATNEEQLLGHPLLDRIHPDFRDIVDKRAQSVYEGKTVPRMEQQYLKMDGTPFDAEVSVVPFRYQGENGALVFLRDITARKKTEIAIQEGARLNQLLLDSLPCVTLLLKPLTREIVAANAAAIKVGAVPGKQCFATWAQRQAPCPFCLAPRVWETNQDQHLEIEYGGVYWDAHWVPIKKDLYLHYAFDITQRKEEEKIKQTLEAQIFQAQKMEALGTLAGGIAHDFNNILGSMTGFAELTALDLPETAEGRYYLNYLLKAAERARHLVKQILSFSRQEQTERRPIALTPVVKETLKFLRASLPTTIEIRTHLKAENDMIVADPTQIHQVLLNLATNAAHAMEEKGGVLEISLENVQLSPEENVTYKGGWLPGPFLELRVGDTGHGMEPEVLERIFDPFFTTKDPGKGTGLGLSVVYGIIKDHEGVIQATSTPGKGTTFRVLFPEVQVPLLEVTHEESQQIYKGSGHILFVDDDVDFFQMGKEMLGSLGYRVAAYESSIVALDIFKANPHRFDLIICDQTMPGLTGLELAVACSRLRPDIPIILCTGFSESITPEKVKAAGIDEVVTKPYNLHQISKIIKKVLKKSEPATE